jgi:hypothetical protein
MIQAAKLVNKTQQTKTKMQACEKNYQKRFAFLRNATIIR